MKIEINEKEYDVHFGIGFIRELDKMYFSTGVGGAKFGTGIEVSIPKLQSGDISALQDLLYLGISDKKPSQREMDKYIDNHEDIDRLIDEVIEELKNSNAARKRTTEVLKILDEGEKKN